MAKCRMSAMPRVDDLAEMLARSRRLLVLTGAGCSTESGIPDYRDELGAWKRPPPMSYQEFIGSAAARQRYWARGSIGWRRIRSVLPGRAHRALARLEHAGRIDCVITQNVDGLHQRAGSRRVIDLHGRIDAVHCLHCRGSFARERIQARLDALNPQWAQLQAGVAPDGDAQLDAALCGEFQLVDCEHCRGPLKPAVVFFGEAVPQATVSQAYAALARADALLVVGSSLMVYSGYRFVRAACERALPVALVNRGTTRADAQVPFKIEGSCGEVLEQVIACMIEARMIGSEL
jgi:NAD-dependent SIR2 family protein deacetylase